MKRDQHHRDQPSLFDSAAMTQVLNQQPVARSTDPATSLKSADEIASSLGKLQHRMWFIWCRQRGTANEIAAECVKQFGEHMPESYRKRKKELYDRGLIRWVSTRKCAITGATCEVFEGVK